MNREVYRRIKSNYGGLGAATGGSGATTRGLGICALYGKRSKTEEEDREA